MKRRGPEVEPWGFESRSRLKVFKVFKLTKRLPDQTNRTGIARIIRMCGIISNLFYILPETGKKTYIANKVPSHFHLASQDMFQVNICHVLDFASHRETDQKVRDVLTPQNGHRWSQVRRSMNRFKSFLFWQVNKKQVSIELSLILVYHWIESLHEFTFSK